MSDKNNVVEFKSKQTEDEFTEENHCLTLEMAEGLADILLGITDRREMVDFLHEILRDAEKFGVLQEVERRMEADHNLYHTLLDDSDE